MATEVKASPTSPKSEELENNEPMKFLGSKAASWEARRSRSGGADEGVSFQPYVISLSLAVFLVYFCILREENDIDLDLEKSLFDRVDGLEQTSLLMTHRYNKENGVDNTAIETRLNEMGVEFE